MKTEAELRRELEEVESDERLQYPAADVHVNAVLAIIQIERKAVARTLRSVLGLPQVEYHQGASKKDGGA